jgi:hypothetical protein
LFTKGKRWIEHVADVGERCVPVLVGKQNAKRLFVRLSCRWENNTKMVIQAVVWERGMNLYALRQGQVVSSCECDKGNSGSIKCWELLD